jgi:hypothetical protein
MLVIHGAYHFRPKRVAFRNDYCLSCGQTRQSVAIRTIDVGHIFWIPILPVGAWKHWKCMSCGRDPHVSPKTRRSFKWAGLVVLVLISIVFWAMPMESEDALWIWAGRIGSPLCTALLLRHLLRTPSGLSLRQLLAMVEPAADTICPFCNTPLIGGSPWSCPVCGVVRY